MFRHFGSKVTVLERAPQLHKQEDADVVEALGGVMMKEGVEIQLNCSVQRVEKEGNGIAVILTTDCRMSDGGLSAKTSAKVLAKRWPG
jgi:pyruvate/2-oxoglutarate dehydrogenase complex dihydrolipoamide dehydrogenase (E3) component